MVKGWTGSIQSSKLNAKVWWVQKKKETIFIDTNVRLGTIP